CASAPPVAAPPPPPAPPPPVRPTFEQKMSGLLRLEDQRLLRDPVDATAPAADTPGTLPPPDLTRLLGDEEARVRRRAALAVGRVGLADGVEPLLPLLSDADPEVRQMAAFALGL